MALIQMETVEESIMALIVSIFGTRMFPGSTKAIAGLQGTPLCSSVCSMGFTNSKTPYLITSYHIF